MLSVGTPAAAAAREEEEESAVRGEKKKSFTKQWKRALSRNEEVYQLMK